MLLAIKSHSIKGIQKIQSRLSSKNIKYPCKTNSGVSKALVSVYLPAKHRCGNTWLSIKTQELTGRSEDNAVSGLNTCLGGMAASANISYQQGMLTPEAKHGIRVKSNTESKGLPEIKVAQKSRQQKL